MSDSAAIFRDFLRRYGPAAGEEGILLFAREVLGIEKFDAWQEDVLRDIARGERRISIRACHGVGKTMVAAVAVVYTVCLRFPQKTVVTAPSKAQLEDALVAEVKKWMTKLPPALQTLFTIKQNRIELTAAADESFFSARTARAESPEALQGVHSDPGYVLLIADEGSGVPEAIYEAASGSMSGHNCTTLLLSNPVRSSGFFYDTHHKLKDMWRTYHVSYKDSSRVSPDFVRDIARRYGENSNAYRIRVLGEFPLADSDTIIPFELIEAARNRDIVVRRDLREVWGLDVARFGDDSNALVRRNKLAVLPDIQVWGGVDLMKTAGRVKRLYDDLEDWQKPDEILVDVIGLGAGVVDRLRELGLPVRGVNVSETASNEEQYRNLRTELWFSVKSWLQARDRALPNCDKPCGTDCVHEQLASELAAVRFGYTSGGKQAAESKAEMKKRGHKSPNVADALCLTFASEPATLIHGSKNSLGNTGSDWNKPVRRGLKVL
jgi:phage terminase large subunit